MSPGKFNRVLFAMRAFCPTALVLSLWLASLNRETGSWLAFGVCCFCGGIQLVLSWIQWFHLKPMQED